MEKKNQRDADEHSRKISSLLSEHEEVIERLKAQHSRQMEKRDLHWIEQISYKNIQISELEKSRQGFLSKISGLQEENREIRELNAALQEEVKQNESYKKAYQDKIKELTVNHEEKLVEMERKLSQERLFWNLRDVDSKVTIKILILGLKGEMVPKNV